MNEDTLPVRTRGLPGKRAISQAEAEELRQLLDELQDTVAAAAEVFGKVGPAPTGMALERFKELDGRVLEIVDRVQGILG